MNTRTKTTITTTAVLLAGLLAIGGCNGANKDKNGYSQDKRAPLDDPDDTFGTKKEPAVKAATHVAAAKVADSRGDTLNAIDQYDRAVAIDPTLADVWYQLGVLNAKARQYDKSVDAWEHYLKLSKESANAYANLGFAYDLAGRRRDAEKAFEAGVKSDPQNRACRVNYGLFLAKNGKMDDATAQFAAVLPPAEVHYNIGSVYEQQNKPDPARAEYIAALKLDPQFTAARSRLAKLPPPQSAVSTTN